MRTRWIAVGFAALCGACGGSGGSGAIDLFLPATPPAVATGDAPTGIAVGLFDADAFADVAVASNADSSVRILLGNGDGTFAAGPTVALPTGSAPYDVAAAFLNADAFVDLAVANSGSSTVSLLFGAGDGTFALGSPVVLPVGANNVYGVAVADLSGEGIADIAATSAADATLAIFFGDGLGGFAYAGSLGTGAGPRRVVARDFTGDGLLDLAIAGRDSDSVRVWVNSVGGTIWLLGPDVPVGDAPWDLAVADFDGDGALDFASPADTDGTVHVLLGAGDGTFAPAPGGPAAVGAFPYGIVARDFDLDGVPDLAVANYDDDDLSILVGDGDGTFTAIDREPVGAGPYPIGVADFNGDGLLDLVVGNEDADTVSVLLHR